jgi:Flp pilus assembly protein TadD
MLRAASAVAGGVVLLAVVVLTPLRQRYDGRFPDPIEPAAQRDASTDRFVGAERCASCHTGQFARWRTSTHGRAGGTPSPEIVLAPFAGAPIRFANAVVTPRIRGGTYEFVVRRTGETETVLRVDGVVGGGHIYGGGTQAYVTDLPDGSWRVLPFEWSRHQRAWFCNTNSRSGQGWRVIRADMPLEACGDWPPIRALGEHPRYANCQSCHASQATVMLDTAVQGFRTRFTSLAINCESCHGPGQRHVELAERGAGNLPPGSDIGFVALAANGKDASISVCLQCHAVKDQLQPGLVSGDTLEAFYSLRLPLLGDRPLLPDGRTRTFAYQEGHLFSDCYVNGGMTCVSCHDPHSQGYRTVTGEPLTGRFDDRQCTSCHVSKADSAVLHTRHPPSVSCVSCHMPARQQPETRGFAPASAPVVPYARYDHTISIPRPRLDSTLGLASACASCHAGLATADQEVAMRRWWGDIKPLPRVVAAQLQATANASPWVALLGDSADGGDSRPMSRFAGLSRYLESAIHLDQQLPAAAEARLRELAASTDVDIRAAALASLHLTGSGSRAGTRRFLAAALRAEGARDLALRARWSTVLGYLADRYASAAATEHAVNTYERAIAVRPGDARLLLSLGNARRDAGDLTGAVASYQRSIALDPRWPLTWVNLGIALTQAGDTSGATTALVRAATLDASEPLAWYNLGNLALLKGDLAGAASLYERVTAQDASIVPAHFQLARVALLRADSVQALRHLTRGLAFDSTDMSARAQERILRRGPLP